MRLAAAAALCLANRMKLLGCVWMLSLFMVVSAFPQGIDYETAHLSRILTAVRINEEISLDGRLEEPAWKLAIPATDFLQQRPKPGEPAHEATEVRILYDQDNLYVGFTCFDSEAGKMVINDLREDFAFGESDTVTVYLDSLRDRRSGFSFTVNPAGARRDTQMFNESQFLADWDGVWDAKVTRNDEGWIAEFVIPFKTLRFSSSPSQSWGMNLERKTLRLNENFFWSPIPIRYNGARMSMAGTLTGLENMRQGRNLKVKPFVTAGVRQIRSADGQLQTTQSLSRLKDYDGGVDVKYSITPSLTLDGTYRTDFAQVEVDQQQVNLTRFSLFFPEKREFFLENAGIFTFGSAGNSANLVPFFSRRIGLSAAGNPIPIVGGTRVSGKIRKYDVGFLAMKTERLNATPSNNFLVGRVKRDLWTNSWIGTLVTSRDSIGQQDHNRVYGTDAHFQFFNKLEFDSYILRSNTQDLSGKNLARRFQSAWRDDELVIGGEYNEVQPNFNPEVGFIRRKDVANYSGEFAWRPLFTRNDTIRNLNFGTNFDYYAGSGSGKIETRTQEATIGVVFDNQGSINFGINRNFDRLPTELRIPSGSPRVSIAPGDYKYQAYTANAATNPSWKIAGNGRVNWGEFYNGRNTSFAGGLNVRFNYHLNVNLTYERNQLSFPNRSFTTNLVGTRFSYAFTPRAFLNAFLQYNADTHQVSSNIRFNLIHHPLSDLFLVYTDRRDTLKGQLLDRAFVVKVTNLFNF